MKKRVQGVKKPNLPKPPTIISILIKIAKYHFHKIRNVMKMEHLENEQDKTLGNQKYDNRNF